MGGERRDVVDATTAPYKVRTPLFSANTTAKLPSGVGSEARQANDLLLEPQ